MLPRSQVGGRQQRASRQRRLPFRLRFDVLEARCLLTFAPPAIYAAGQNPAAAATALLNDDNHLDLIIVNQDDSSVSVYLGQGDGSFGQTPVDFATGPGPRSIAVGDFNDDDMVDLATANSSGGSVSVLLGRGDGSFQPRQDYGIPAPNPFETLLSTPALVTGDVDHDGNMDLVATSVTETPGYYGNYQQSYANVLLGNGIGGFQSPVAFPLPNGFTFFTYPQDVALGDVTGDGHLDVVTAQSEGYVSVLPGSGTGTFLPGQLYVAGTGTVAIAVADLNGDGHVDVAAASGASQNKITVFFNKGDGSLLPFQQFDSGTTPQDVAVADFNGDGSLDLATANGATSEHEPVLGAAAPVQGSVSVILNLGNSTFSKPVSVGTAAHGILSANLNDDDRPDLVALTDGAVVLLNDGAWPVLTAPTLSITNAVVKEGHAATAAAVFIVTLSTAATSLVTVDYATANGSATEGVDYVAQQGTLTFVPGQTTQIIMIHVNGDRLGEMTESFTVTLRNPSNAFLSDAHAVGVIQDDEPRITIGDASVVEGNTGTSEAKFKVSLNAAYDTDVTLTFATAAGGAAPGSDFEDVADSITIPAGETSGFITVLIAGDRVFERTQYLIDDGSGYGGYYVVWESHELFVVQLTGVDHGVFLDAQGTGTILDDEPRISVAGTAVVEGNDGATPAIFVVSLAAAYDVDVTVAYTTAPGTLEPKATAGVDYEATSSMVTIPAGQTSQTITVDVFGDRIAESFNNNRESFSIVLSSPNFGDLSNAEATGQIIDDEPLFDVKSLRLTEGNTGDVRAVFKVKLAASSTEPVTIAYATADSDAKGGSDYRAKSGSLTFNPGQRTKSITVLVRGDHLDEFNEEFFLRFNDAGDGHFLMQARALIRDDDQQGRFSISDAQVVEGDSGTSLLRFTVKLSGVSGKDTWVSYVARPGTASFADRDYERTGDELHFAPGETVKQISVVITGDGKREASETVLVDLFRAFGATISDGQGVGTIANDD